TQENHGGSKRLIRVGYRLRLRAHTKLLWIGALVGAVATVLFGFWLAAAVAGLLLAFVAGVWLRGTFLASRAVELVDLMARRLHLVSCGLARQREEGKAAAHQTSAQSMARLLRQLKEGEIGTVEAGASIAPIPHFVLSTVKQQEGTGTA